MDSETEAQQWFQPIKQWYANKSDLKLSYGEFPQFWQDLLKWEPFREVKRVFLTETEEKKEAPKRRKRSRWSTAENENTTETTQSVGETKRKRSRWSAEETAAPTATGMAQMGMPQTMGGPPVPAAALPLGQQSVVPITGNMPQTQMQPLAFQHLPRDQLSENQAQILDVRREIEEVNQKMLTLPQDAAAKSMDPNRSPSPAPITDPKTGLVSNSREARMRQKLVQRKQELFRRMVSLTPMASAAQNQNRSYNKCTKKHYIPEKEYPGYNFIGLIIGPRGNTQKRLEKEFNCKISIRGKGSVKEGKNRKPQPDDDDDIHVFLMAENEQDLERASEEIQRLLTPVDDDTNEHKQKQLEELALINGMRYDNNCHFCGGTGHRQHECPNRMKEMVRPSANVRCSICGDQSHPTADCPHKGRYPPEGSANDADTKDFMNFMSSLDGDNSNANQNPNQPRSGPPSTANASGRGGFQGGNRGGGGFRGGRGNYGGRGRGGLGYSNYRNNNNNHNNFNNTNPYNNNGPYNGNMAPRQQQQQQPRQPYGRMPNNMMMPPQQPGMPNNVPNMLMHQAIPPQQHMPYGGAPMGGYGMPQQQPMGGYQGYQQPMAPPTAAPGTGLMGSMPTPMAPQPQAPMPPQPQAPAPPMPDAGSTATGSNPPPSNPTDDAALLNEYESFIAGLQ
eukprot:TRINITY_DN56062_c0_g1_i1.p1 TRINITY_DN56062_c0_g1~~TRINITY_DN56062_c0_g1_i1.p1  ORF type:complete len:676 (-),score=269.19 TRINITY_DN56062_c0_g1_i1:649-2676(-)